MSNALVDMMREYGLEVRLLSTEEEPSPDGVVIGDMLMEIHRLRKRIAAYEESRPVVSDEDLFETFAAALEDQHAKGAAETQAHLGQQIISGIRAVRAKLEGEHA